MLAEIIPTGTKVGNGIEQFGHVCGWYGGVIAHK
jgi:hypothetical protein